MAEFAIALVNGMEFGVTANSYKIKNSKLIFYDENDEPLLDEVSMELPLKFIKIFVSEDGPQDVFNKYSICNCKCINKLPDTSGSSFAITPPQKCIKCGKKQTINNSNLLVTNVDILKHEV